MTLLMVAVIGFRPLAGGNTTQVDIDRLCPPKPETAAKYRAGAYPPAARSYREAAKMAYRYMTSLPAMTVLVETGKPNQKYQHNAYVSKTHAAHIKAMLDWAKLEPEKRETAMRFAKASAEFLLKELEPADAPLAFWPPTYGRKPLEFDPKTDGPYKKRAMIGNEPEAAVKYRGEVMLLYPADVGSAFVDYWRETKDDRFLVAAKGIAETYLRMRRAGGGWPLKMKLATGEPIGENTLVPNYPMALFNALHDATGDQKWKDASDACFAWLEEHPLKDWNWDGQFEDIRPCKPYANPTKHNAVDTVIEMLRRYPGDATSIAQCRKIMEFCEKRFVVWEAPENHPKWPAPSVLEQYSCFTPIDASAAKMICGYLAMYRAEGRAEDLAKARALADTVTRVQKPSGRIPTFWEGVNTGDSDLSNERYDWLNCMAAAAKSLTELSCVTEAASDAERNDSTEMNAEKDVAAASCVKEGVRILFLGNSITLHGSLPKIGWTNVWGMAASAKEKDYVHLVTRGIEREAGRKADLRVRNLADFERNFRTWSPAENLKAEVAFVPDYLIVALGENVPDLSSSDDRLAYRKAFKGLLGAFLDGRRRRPNIIVRGVFWPNPTKDHEMAHVASDYAVPFVRADLSGDRSMTAAGLFTHGGVANHPGDRGMAVIAERILDGLFPKESGYAAWVDDRPVEVRPIRVSAQPFNQWASGYQRPVDQTEIAGLLRFETEGTCQLRVRQTPGLGPLRPTTNVLVRPLSHGVGPRVEGNGDITFSIPKPGYYVLEIDGLHRPLEIFAQPKRDFAAERREANIVFGPGRHEPVVVKLKSHDRVYIDRDAVVFGSFQADGVEDVKVSGYGIICGSRNRRVGDWCYREGMDGAVRVIDSTTVTFDGPTVIDSCCWCVAAFNSSDLAFRNLKVTGAWRYNTDGIDICNSQRVHVKNCYVHSFDDALVVKGNYPERDSRDPVEDVRFSGCVCWCGWGNTLEVGFETWAKHMRGISFEGCDLIHNNNRAMSVHLGGPAVVEDVTYRDIRIECDGSDERSILQKGREQKVICQKGNQCSWLAVSNEKMFTQNGMYSASRDFSKEPYGTLQRLTVENVSIRCTNGAARPTGWASAQPGSSFGEVSISNVTMDGAAVDLGEIKRAFARTTLPEDGK